MRTPLATGQPIINGMESSKARTMTAEEQLQATAGFDQPRRQIHELLHHRFDPSPLGRMPHRGHLSEKPHLPDSSQDIVGESPKGQDQGIGFELSRGKPLHVHIRFYFAMKLLARTMILIEPDHILCRHIESGPPPFKLDLGGDTTVTTLVYGPP